MKSFFEFYNHLKDRKLREADMNVPAAPAQIGGMGGSAPAAAPTNAPNAAGTGVNQPGFAGQDMDLNMGGQTEGDGMTKQTDEPVGEQDPAQMMDSLKQLAQFIKNFGVGDDQEKSEKKDELTKQIQAVMENLGTLTGSEVPSDDEQADGEMGGDQLADDGSQPNAGSSGMGAGGTAPLGGNMPSNSGGSGDMGGNAAGGSSPDTQAGGSGGFSF
jgi:hypothetical protein